jgi:CRISPR-associated protein Csh2
MEKFEKRVFGCAIIKAINSNYNADFSGQPRTLPDGTVYATDKAFKYSVKNYIKDVYPDSKVFYFKSLNETMNPISLDESYKKHFGEYPKGIGKDKDKIVKPTVAKNILSCLDVRLFGATFAGETNISIHGTVQVNHGINIWHENNIYSEQITSPFSNKANDPDAERGNTTLGRQSKLQEGHYVHHFSVNPQNLKDVLAIEGSSIGLSTDDIATLKEAMRRGATWYDSAAKAGTENELLIWVQLNSQSKLVLPNFTSFVAIEKAKQDGKSVYDLSKLATELKKYQSEIEAIEIYVNAQTTVLKSIPEKAQIKEL